MLDGIKSMMEKEQNNILRFAKTSLPCLLYDFCSWDEWVPENRVLKYNDQALQKQKELLKAHEATS